MSSHIEVCVKAFRLDDHLIDTFPVEAVLTSTRCYPNLPWFYGLSEHGPRKMIVLSFHGINGKSYTIHKALQTNCQDLSIDINWKVILVGMASALNYIHNKNILHNDKVRQHNHRQQITHTSKHFYWLWQRLWSFRRKILQAFIGGTPALCYRAFSSCPRPSSWPLPTDWEQSHLFFGQSY